MELNRGNVCFDSVSKFRKTNYLANFIRFQVKHKKKNICKRIKGKLQKGNGNETGHRTQNLAEVSKTAGNVNKAEMAQVDELCFDNLDEFINDENKLVNMF